MFRTSDFGAPKILVIFQQSLSRDQSILRDSTVVLLTIISAMSNKSSSKKQHCCPCCRSTSFSSVRGLTTHMTQYCSSRPISSQNKARNNLLGKDSAYAGNKVTALSNLHPISKRCVQDNVPQFGSISCSVSNDIVPTPFPNIDPRNPTSEKHPHLYNHVSLVNGHQASMDKIRAEDESNSTCSPCADLSFDGRDQEFSSSTYSENVCLKSHHIS